MFSVRAQGVIIPVVCEIRPCRPIPRPLPLPNVLPVKSIKLDVKIENQVAITHVEQVFRNDTAQTLEGTYFFPIPETASVVEFAIWENGKKLVGEVRSRDEARRIYDAIVRSQRDPGLLEYAGKNLLQASVFPIPPNSDKKIELTYSQILKSEAGTVAYRYPLGTGRNLWTRRQPPVNFPAETSRPSAAATQTFGTVAGKIEIAGKETLRNVYSPSHQIEVNKKSANGASVSFETETNDSDFQMFFSRSESDFGMSLITHREPGKDGYFLLMISPKENIAERELVSKDIVFVLDTSGSMADEGKMEKARAALLFGIRGLRDGDRFNVINFAGEEHLMENRLTTANAEGKSRGEEFVKKLTPNGGTNINDALRAALRQFDSSDRPKMLVFMTDGLPTVGESNIEKIIANARAIKVENLRLFPLGVGYDVNTQLLDRLAAENSGAADYVEPKENLEVKVSNFFTKVNSPVLSNLELNFGEVQTDLIYPHRLTDVFKGEQLTIIGRYKNPSAIEKATLVLSGKAGQNAKNFRYANLKFPLRENQNEFLPRLWATRRVGWLIEQIRSNGENKELRDEIVDLGTRFGIVTPYTSYLATDGELVAPAPTSRNQRLENNQSITMLPQNGRAAVQMSKQQNTLQSNISADAAKDKKSISVFMQNTLTNQFVGGKNFVSENGFWVDAEFKEEKKLPEISVKFASPEYFNLVAAEPALNQYFALGRRIVVVWNEKVYRVEE